MFTQFSNEPHGVHPDRTHNRHSDLRILIFRGVLWVFCVFEDGFTIIILRVVLWPSPRVRMLGFSLLRMVLFTMTILSGPFLAFFAIN
jgi:hypothetical protein